MTRQHTADTDFQVGAQRLDAVLSAVQAKHTRALQGGIAAGRDQRRCEIKNYVLEKLKSKGVGILGGRSGGPEKTIPRVWYIWRGNAIVGSMKGTRVCPEALSRHALERSSPRIAEDHTEEVKWHDVAAGRQDGSRGRSEFPHGFLGAVLRHRPACGLVVREGGSEQHRSAFVHPSAFARRSRPVWESKTDWDIFKAISPRQPARLARRTSRRAAEGHHCGAAGSRYGRRDHPTRDQGLVSRRMRGDSRQDHAQAEPWWTATTPKIYDKFITLGDKVIRKTGLGAHGNHYMCE